MSDLQDLIVRLGNLAGPSRDADAEIATAAGWRLDQLDVEGRSKWLPPKASLTRYLPEFTASIDAALTLVSMPRGVTIEFGWRYDPAPAAVTLGGAIPVAHAATPAIALCIAALKAREGEDKP